MARDYARRGRRKRNASGGKGLWILAMFLTGIFVAGLMFLKNIAARDNVRRTTIATSHQNTKTTSTKSAAVAPQPPKFDFYTMLPKVTLPDEAQQTTSIAPPPLPPPTAGQLNVLENRQLGQSAITSPATAPPDAAKAAAAPDSAPKVAGVSYFIQLGVFKDFASADELKAQVILQGFEVNVTTLQRKNGPLYRVWLGPYKTLVDARAQQKTLKENQIKNTLVTNKA